MVALISIAQATRLLSEIFPGSSPKVGSGYWDQIQEVAIISVIKRILQHLHDVVDLVRSIFVCNN
jgi:zinc finger FYVE domain-containing protein 26